MVKSESQFSTIDEYIASFPPETREHLQTLRETIREVAPSATEAIKYRMPTFVLHGNLVHFAAFKKHISLFPATAEMEESIEGLSAYTSGKVTIQFPHSQPLPLSLIREGVWRVDELRRKAS